MPSKHKHKKKRKKKLHKETIRESVFTRTLKKVLLVKIMVVAGIIAFLMLFAPVFVRQTGKIAVIMFGARGLGFALTGIVTAWIALLLAGHIWDIRPVGKKEREIYMLDFLKRTGICLTAVCLLLAWTGFGVYYGTDNVKKSAADCRTGYVQAKGRVKEARYDYHRHGPSEYKYTIEFYSSSSEEYEFSKIIVSTYRKIRAKNTGKILVTGEYGTFYFYPQTHVIDHVNISR